MYHITGILMTRILFPQESETIAVKINLDTHVLSYLYSIKTCILLLHEARHWIIHNKYSNSHHCYAVMRVCWLQHLHEATM